MKRKPRDYKLEYQRRIARAMAEGHSRSQARGHPKAGEAFISKPAKAKPVKPLKGLKEPFALIDPKRPEEQALKAMKKGASLKAAAASEGISQERLRKYLKDQTEASHKGRRWTIIDDRPRQFPFYSEERLVTAWLQGNVLSDVEART